MSILPQQMKLGMPESMCLIINPEENIQYRWINYEYDVAEIHILHPNLDYKFELDRTSFKYEDIQDGADLLMAITHHLAIDLKKVIYTRGLKYG